MSVEVDFDVTVLHVVDGFVGDGLARQVSGQGGLEEYASVVAGAVGDALQVELEGSPLEEEVDVLEVGLHVLVDGGLAVHVEVVLDLHLVVDEDLAPAFGVDDFLLQGHGGAVAKEIHRFLQIRNHAVDFVLEFRDFVF